MPFVAHFKQESGGGGHECLSDWLFQAGEYEEWGGGVVECCHVVSDND